MEALKIYADKLMVKAQRIMNRIALTDEQRQENLIIASTYQDIAEDIYRTLLNRNGEQPQEK